MSYFDILAARAGAGGGAPTPQPVLIEKSVTENGTYTALEDEADGYSSVSVEVPNTYSASDEGKVVSNGTLVAQTAYPSEITANNTYDTTNYNSVTVNVPAVSNAYKLTFIPNSSMYRSTATSELYSINSNSSTTVFGYFVLKTGATRCTRESLSFSFDSAFTPSFASTKLNSSSSPNINANCSASITSAGKYRIDISTNGTLYENSTYRFYIQTLFV